jgi:hypothetical protein
MSETAKGSFSSIGLKPAETLALGPILGGAK